MKKLLILTIALAVLAIPHSPKADDIAFGGVNYEGNVGFLFGIGHTFGKVGGRSVSVMPYYRFSIDSTLQDETRFTKSTGIETAIWLYQSGDWKFGLLASPFNVDWIDNQEGSLGAYLSGSGGLTLRWWGGKYGLALWGKLKTDFKTTTSYNDLKSFGMMVFTKKFW